MKYISNILDQNANENFSLILSGTARGCTSKIPEKVMSQLHQEGMERDNNCNNMTTVKLGPESTSIAVAMCACNTTNCNLGPPNQESEDDQLIGAMMPQTEIASTLPLTGLLIDQML